jgi:hypothetical protein
MNQAYYTGPGVYLDCSSTKPPSWKLMIVVVDFSLLTFPNTLPAYLLLAGLWSFYISFPHEFEHTSLIYIATMSPVLLRRQDEIIVDDGHRNWWYSQTAQIVKWSILGGIIVRLEVSTLSPMITF